MAHLQHLRLKHAVYKLNVLNEPENGLGEVCAAEFTRLQWVAEACAERIRQSAHARIPAEFRHKVEHEVNLI